MKKNPKIVFLDEGTIGCGDLDLSPLKKIGIYQSYFHSTEEQTLKRISSADIVIANKVYLGAKEIENAKHLKMIAVPATGYNNVDLAAAQKHGIVVTNVVGYASIPTSEQALTMMLALGHRLLPYQQSTMTGEWQKSKQSCYTAYPFSNLNGKTLGIIGYGNIGKRLATMAKAIGMHVLVGKIPKRQYKNRSHLVSLDVLLKQSDYISLHCPLTPLTHHLINESRLQKMKPTAFLINTARGDVVDENAVAKALEKNKISGYAADAFSKEPLPKNHPFYKKTIRQKVLLTPHMAWASREARLILRDELVKNIQSFLKGKIRNRVL